jgi:ribosome-binding factor A
LLQDEIADPALAGVQPIDVDLSVDARHARVGYIVVGGGLDSTEEQRIKVATTAALERAKGFLRARLASALDLKRTPELGFVFIGAVRP